MLSNVTKALKICKSFREPAKQAFQMAHSCATQTRQRTSLGGSDYSIFQLSRSSLSLPLPSVRQRFCSTWVRLSFARQNLKIIIFPRAIACALFGASLTIVKMSLRLRWATELPSSFFKLLSGGFALEVDGRQRCAVHTYLTPGRQSWKKCFHISRSFFFKMIGNNFIIILF